MVPLKGEFTESSVDKNKGLTIKAYDLNLVESNGLLAANSSFDKLSGRRPVFRSTATSEQLIPKVNSGDGLSVSPGKNVLSRLAIVDTADAVKAKSKLDLPAAYDSMAVLSSVVDGARNEVVNHPDHLLLNAAAGVVIGAGMVFVGRRAAAVIGLAGLTYGAFQTLKNVPTWSSASETVANPSAHSQKEQMEAKAVLSDLGAGVPNLAAGAIGGSFGGRLAGLAKEAFLPPAVGRNPDFRVRVQEQLREANSPAERRLSDLATGDGPDNWLKTYRNSDEYKLLQYKHYLDKIQIIQNNIEKYIPELSLDTPASRRLALAIEKTSWQNRELTEPEKLVPADLQITALAEKITNITQASFAHDGFAFSSKVARELASRTLSKDIPALRFQKEGSTNRFFGNQDLQKLKFEIPAEHAVVIKNAARESESLRVPMAELLKNQKIVDSGFITRTGKPDLGKLSLGIHDVVDHLFVYNELNARGLISGDGVLNRGYGKLFTQFGKGNLRDMFGKESELLASISFNTRSFSLTRAEQEFPITLSNVLQTLKHSSTLSKSVNQKAALVQLENLVARDPSETSRESRLLRHVFSSVSNELMESNRKFGHVLLKEGENGFSLFGTTQPEYLALMLDVIKIVDSPKASTLVRNVNLEMEAALRNRRENDTVALNIPFSDLGSGLLSQGAIDLPSWVVQWFERNPDYRTRRAPVGRSQNSIRSH